MNILLYTWFSSYTDEDIERNLIKMGHSCNHIVNFALQDSDRYENDDFCRGFERLLEVATYDCVFTTNFHPLIARICYEKNIKYVSWSYDSPPNIPDTRNMDLPTNRIFFFSKDDVDDFKSQGLENVYYMPLAVDTEKWDLVNAPISMQKQLYSDVSFVGSLYNSTLPFLMRCMSKEQQTFFSSLVDIQLKKTDKYILKDFITDGIAGEVSKTFQENSRCDIKPTAKQLIYATAAYVTHIDRLLLLRILSREHKTCLYTVDATDEVKDMLKDVEIHGPVDYDSEMPIVFKQSKINLCPTFRGNVSGIPLRMLDIMGCESFVLAPYRPEIFDYFEEDKEIVTYRSVEEALEKADYYIKNDDKRKCIAKRGYEKVKRDFKYSDRLARMLEV